MLNNKLEVKFYNKDSWAYNVCVSVVDFCPFSKYLNTKMDLFGYFRKQAEALANALNSITPLNNYEVHYFLGEVGPFSAEEVNELIETKGEKLREYGYEI